MCTRKHPEPGRTVAATERDDLTMASCFSHPAVPLALACWLPSMRKPSLLVTACLLSAAPDLDAIGYFLSVPYDAWCGHRGCTHSLLFALSVAVLVTLPLARRLVLPPHHVLLFLFAAMASHGLVDMATNGGLGIAVLWPIVDWRLFWPIRPIEVAPLGISAFFSARGLDVLASEAVYLWLPAGVFGALGLWLRRGAPSPTTEPSDRPR
ncbi:MAG: metal-dependent hydrolase [Planctomycetota bacterium]